MSAPLGSLSFQQAAHLELHFNPNTNAVCVKLAAMTKGRYSFMILRMLELVSGISLPPLGVQFKEGWAGLSTLTESSECGIFGFEDFDCCKLLYCGREDGEYQLNCTCLYTVPLLYWRVTSSYSHIPGRGFE